MKKFTMFALSIILCACWGCSKKEKVAIRIGDISITASEFNDAFEEGRFQSGMELSRKDFLDATIVRKLILKEAEDLGLDSDPQVLKSLQIFWEQTLLKLALARKINEITVPINITDEEIIAFYEENKDEDFAGKEFSDIRNEIKLVLFRKKQQQALREWTDNLHNKKRIVIDYQLLGIQ
ncbi:MAG: hypothetical protein ABIG31_00860 [Candidatus Omnitrophota bacterium]